MCRLDRLHVQNAIIFKWQAKASKLIYLSNSFHLRSPLENFRREASLSPVEDTGFLFLTSLEGGLFLHC